MGCSSGKPGKITQKGDQKQNNTQKNENEEKYKDNDNQKQDNEHKNNSNPNNYIEDTKAEDPDKKNSSPESNDKNNNNINIDISNFKFEIPQQYQSQKEIEITQKWSFLIGEDVYNKLLFQFHQKNKSQVNYNNEFWLLVEVKSILQYMGIKTDENKVEIIRNTINQIQKYRESYDHREDKTVLNISTQIQQEFQQWISIFFIESSSTESQKNSLQQLLQITLTSLFYINNLYNQQKDQILHHGNHNNNNVQKNKVPYICFQNNADTEKILQIIKEVKQAISKDFPYINDYKMRQQRSKVQATVFLNELYTKVQRQCRTNKSPFEISNDYLTEMYSNVIITMGEVVPQDDYNHLGYQAKIYQQPQSKKYSEIQQKFKQSLPI